MLASVSMVACAALGPRVVAQPPVSPPPAALETHGTTADLHLTTGIVGHHQTSFDPADAPRARNVQLAASMLDGATLRPHHRLSFDERIGPRTPERGFLDAETLLNGVPTPGIGGGICQVATTLFVAAFTAGLPVHEVHPHTRLPHYARPGMDAAIASARFDLVLENPLAELVTIRARTERDQLIVELASSAPPLEVAWDTTIEETTTLRDRVERVRGMSDAERRVIDEGATGWSVLRTRVVRQEGHAHRDRAHVRYHAFPRIVQTGRRRAS